MVTNPQRKLRFLIDVCSQLPRTENNVAITTLKQKFIEHQAIFTPWDLSGKV